MNPEPDPVIAHAVLQFRQKQQVTTQRQAAITVVIDHLRYVAATAAVSIEGRVQEKFLEDESEAIVAAVVALTRSQA